MIDSWLFWTSLKNTRDLIIVNLPLPTMVIDQEVTPQPVYNIID